jgi:hypothetical protein
MLKKKETKFGVENFISHNFNSKENLFVLKALNTCQEIISMFGPHLGRTILHYQQGFIRLRIRRFHAR